ncbi:MAG TPA: hypothetical protein VGF74_05185 [Thermoleophilaceae bacterium]
MRAREGDPTDQFLHVGHDGPHLPQQERSRLALSREHSRRF